MQAPTYQAPKMDADRYAMHYGVTPKLDHQQLAEIQIILGRFGGTVYQQGDNFFEWGEPVMSREEVYGYGSSPMGLDTIDRLNAQAHHVVLYVNKGNSPVLVNNRIRPFFLPCKLSFIRARWRFLDLPFCLTDAVDWSQGGNNSWRLA